MTTQGSDGNVGDFIYGTDGTGASGFGFVEEEGTKER